VGAFSLSRKGSTHKENEDRHTCLADLNAYAVQKLALSPDLTPPTEPAPPGSVPPAHSLFAIYDGHGGHSMSSYAAEMLHRHLLLGEAGAIAVPPTHPHYLHHAHASDEAIGAAGGDGGGGGGGEPGGGGVSFRLDPEASLLRAFERTEADLARYYAKNHDPAGSCAVVALVRGGVLWVANVGDSRALIVTVQDSEGAPRPIAAVGCCWLQGGLVAVLP
jgi:serine/threonine protein phosphatase PrpC